MGRHHPPRVEKDVQPGGDALPDGHAELVGLLPVHVGVLGAEHGQVEVALGGEPEFNEADVLVEVTGDAALLADQVAVEEALSAHVDQEILPVALHRRQVLILVDGPKESEWTSY